MIMICNIPDEVVKSVKMGTWCGSSVAEKMIANGIPLDDLRAEIDSAKMPKNRMSFFRDGINTALEIIDKYTEESEDSE